MIETLVQVTHGSSRIRIATVDVTGGGFEFSADFAVLRTSERDGDAICIKTVRPRVCGNARADANSGKPRRQPFRIIDPVDADISNGRGCWTSGAASAATPRRPRLLATAATSIPIETRRPEQFARTRATGRAKIFATTLRKR